MPVDGPGKGIQVFVFGDALRFNDINDAADRLFPEEVKMGLLPNQGHFVVRPRVSVDQSKFTNSFNIKLKGWDDMVKSVKDQYLELITKEDEAARPE